MMEADHHVGHLHAGVVDVVLHLDAAAARPQHAYERVAEHRVAQVADVRRLVRIDVGVLDDDLALVRPGGFFLGARKQRHCVRRAVDPNIQIAVARHFERGHARNRAKFRGQFGGDGLRRLPQLPRKLERDRQRKFAELGLLRRFHRDRRIDSVAAPNVRRDRLLEDFFD